MTVTPGDSGAAPGYAVPDHDAADEDVDVLYLAGQRPPAEGAWLPGPAALRGPPGTIDALLRAAGQAWPAAAGQRSLRS